MCLRSPESSQERLLGGGNILLVFQYVWARVSDAHKQAPWRGNESRHKSDHDSHTFRIEADQVSLRRFTLIRKNVG